MSSLDHPANDTLAGRILLATGESVAHCVQCGRCAAGCPLSADMDNPPCEVLRLIQQRRPEADTRGPRVALDLALPHLRDLPGRLPARGGPAADHGLPPPGVAPARPHPPAGEGRGRFPPLLPGHRPRRPAARGRAREPATGRAPAASCRTCSCSRSCSCAASSPRSRTGSTAAAKWPACSPRTSSRGTDNGIWDLGTGTGLGTEVRDWGPSLRTRNRSPRSARKIRLFDWPDWESEFQSESAIGNTNHANHTKRLTQRNPQSAIRNPQSAINSPLPAPASGSSPRCGR